MKKFMALLLVAIMVLGSIGVFAIDYYVPEYASRITARFYVVDEFEQDGVEFSMINEEGDLIIHVDENTLIYFETSEYAWGADGVFRPNMVRDMLKYMSYRWTVAGFLNGRMLTVTVGPAVDTLPQQGSPISIEVLFEEYTPLSETMAWTEYGIMSWTPLAPIDGNLEYHGVGRDYEDRIINGAMEQAFATAISSPVLVNGVEFEFEAYTINGFNHFRLRDLAYVLNGTEAQFDVSFDADTNTAYIFRGQPYTPVGSEMTGSADGWQTPRASLTRFIVDGEPKSMLAYNIDGNNFFRLRAIAFLLDFSVEWIDETVVINTSGNFDGEGGDPGALSIPGGVYVREPRSDVNLITDRYVNSERRTSFVVDRNALEERIRLMEDVGLEIPQELLDMLAELD